MFKFHPFEIEFYSTNNKKILYKEYKKEKDISNSDISLITYNTTQFNIKKIRLGDVFHLNGFVLYFDYLTNKEINNNVFYNFGFKQIYIDKTNDLCIHGNTYILGAETFHNFDNFYKKHNSNLELLGNMFIHQKESLNKQIKKYLNIPIQFDLLSMREERIKKKPIQPLLSFNNEREILYNENDSLFLFKLMNKYKTFQIKKDILSKYLFRLTFDIPDLLNIATGDLYLLKNDVFNKYIERKDLEGIYNLDKKQLELLKNQRNIFFCIDDKLKPVWYSTNTNNYLDTSFKLLNNLYDFIIYRDNHVNYDNEYLKLL